jgi:endogenous inhibitor of DNA gyrase (YacG/DUF329 family)
MLYVSLQKIMIMTSSTVPFFAEQCKNIGLAAFAASELDKVFSGLAREDFIKHSADCKLLEHSSSHK